MLGGGNGPSFIVVNLSCKLFRVPLAVACCCLVSMCATRVHGQQNNSDNPAHPPPGSVSSANREGIFRIDAVVTDAAGNLVTDLGPGDFRLLDNGQPTRIFTLQRLTGTEAGAETKGDGPPELIFVFDAISLAPQELAQAEHAGAEFLREDQGRLAQPSFFYRITHDGLFSSSGATTDGNALADEVEKRKVLRAVWRAGIKNAPEFSDRKDQGLRNSLTLRALGSIAIDQRSFPGRKILVWFGHGNPVIATMGCGFNEAAELSTRLREARITVNLASLVGNSGNDEYVAAAEREKGTQPPKLACR